MRETTSHCTCRGWFFGHDQFCVFPGKASISPSFLPDDHLVPLQERVLCPLPFPSEARSSEGKRGQVLWRNSWEADGAEEALRSSYGPKGGTWFLSSHRTHLTPLMSCGMETLFLWLKTIPERVRIIREGRVRIIREGRVGRLSLARRPEVPQEAVSSE